MMVHYGYHSILIHEKSKQFIRDIFDDDLSTPPLTGPGNAPEGYVWRSIKLYRDDEEAILK